MASIMRISTHNEKKSNLFINESYYPTSHFESVSNDVLSFRIAATMEQNMYLKEENLRTAFKMFYKDGSGKASIDEMNQALWAELDGQTRSEEDWNQLIREVDIDETVKSTEFISFHLWLFQFEFLIIIKPELLNL